MARTELTGREAISSPHRLHFCGCLCSLLLIGCFRVQDRPHWQDILPLKLSIWLYLSIKNLPQTIQVGRGSCSALVPVLVSVLSSGLFVFQEVKQYYEDYQQMKQQQREEAEEEQEVAPRKHFLLQCLFFPLFLPKLWVTSCLNSIT